MSVIGMDLWPSVLMIAATALRSTRSSGEGRKIIAAGGAVMGRNSVAFARKVTGCRRQFAGNVVVQHYTRQDNFSQ
jgi:hypothetical protein